MRPMNSPTWISPDAPSAMREGEPTLPLADDGPPPVPPSAPPPEVPPPPPPGDTARSVALWLGGTGAFMLLVAAAVLVAVRWHDLSALMKLSGLIVVNGSVLFAGLRLRDSLPATARALYHLGALLLPISAIAVGIQAGADWPVTLLGASVLTTSALLALDLIEPSPVLRWLALAAVVPACGGLGAVTTAPAGLLLAVAALAVVMTRPASGSPLLFAGLGWAGVSASLVALLAIDDPLVETSRVLGDLGLGATVPAWAHLATGAVAAIAFAIAATRHDDQALALAAIGSMVFGTAAALANGDSNTLGVLPSILLLGLGFELAAMAFKRQRTWGEVLHFVAILAEATMAISLVALGAETIARLDNQHVFGFDGSDRMVLSASLLIVGWLVADQRRRTNDCQSLPMSLLTGGGFWPATVGLAGSVLTLAGAASTSSGVVSWVAVGLTAFLVVSGRAGGHPVAVVVGAVAVASAQTGWEAFIESSAIALLLATAAALRPTSADEPNAGALVLLGAALAAWLAGIAELADSILSNQSAIWVAWVAGAATLTVVAERASTDPVLRRTGLVGRAILLLSFVPVLSGDLGSQTLPAAVLLSGLVVLDVLRSGDERLAYQLAVAVPALAVSALMIGDLSLPETGIGLASIATATTGALVTLRRWDGPVSATAAVLATTAVLFSVEDPGHLSTVLLLLGGAGLLWAIDRQSLGAFATAYGLAVLGFWIRLVVLEIEWAEAYVAPIAALLVVAGVVLAQSGRGPAPAESVLATSWWTHGAAVALLGGVALAERVAGGPGEHSLIAGAVAIVAIIIGGDRRLIGPLVAGTLLVIGVAAHESLAYTATIPTWGWLALGGTVLLASGVAIERTATSPLESGRQVLDTVRTSFR